MNELIEKLAEQAMAKAVAKNFTGEKLELRMPSEAWAKEFAELIVEECIFAIDEQCSNSDAEGTIEAITILQKHFRS